MKKKYKYLILTGLSAVLYLFLIMPAYAQHGGGHSGGGGGGFHGGGGGFHGGGGGGFSGGHAMSAPHFSGTARSGFARGQRGAYHGNSRGNTYNGHGAYGNYGHGGYGHAGYGRVGYGHGGYYGRPYGWRNHNGYFYSHGYYGSLYYPYLGLGFGYLPYGYYPFFWGDDEYYFSNGLYYQYDDDQYTVVEPPVGAAVKTLPSDAQSIVIDGQQYYELNGVYYTPVTKDDGSVVYQIAGKDGELTTGTDGITSVEPQVGDVVTTLPTGSKKVTINGASFYVSDDGIYYQETKDAANNKVYKIVGIESDQSGN